mmetsp:Transcript_165464/g.530948  ORF Transcript_165464/g.530948 Transcript_165464/m.530948 type:complete len:273 (+) Transcript_165464:802-1620(+)
MCILPNHRRREDRRDEDQHEKEHHDPHHVKQRFHQASRENPQLPEHAKHTHDPENPQASGDHHGWVTSIVVSVEVVSTSFKPQPWHQVNEDLVDEAESDDGEIEDIPSPFIRIAEESGEALGEEPRRDLHDEDAQENGIDDEKYLHLYSENRPFYIPHICLERHHDGVRQDERHHETLETWGAHDFLGRRSAFFGGLPEQTAGGLPEQTALSRGAASGDAALNAAALGLIVLRLDPQNGMPLSRHASEAAAAAPAVPNRTKARGGYSAREQA